MKQLTGLHSSEPCVMKCTPPPESETVCLQVCLLVCTLELMLKLRSFYAFCLPAFPSYPPTPLSPDFRGYCRLLKGSPNTIQVDHCLIIEHSAPSGRSDPSTALVADRSLDCLWHRWSPWSGCCPAPAPPDVRRLAEPWVHPRSTRAPTAETQQGHCPCITDLTWLLQPPTEPNDAWQDATVLVPKAKPVPTAPGTCMWVIKCAVWFQLHDFVWHHSSGSLYEITQVFSL